VPEKRRSVKLWVAFRLTAREVLPNDSGMKSTLLPRRNFLKKAFSGGLWIALAAKYAGTILSAAERSGKKIPIGLQLYSVRRECQTDFPGTVHAIGKMGYKGVEFAGYYGRDAKTLRQILDDSGLKCCGTHTGLDTLMGDNLQKTIEFNQTLGNPFLIVPSLPENRRNSAKAWEETAQLFNELAEKVKQHKMRVGYHNHSVEFKPVDGKTPWDIFFDHTNRDVVIQFDTGNAMEGGGKALDFLPKHPGRVASIHAKAYSKSNPKAIIGEDELPWKEIFNICETKAGTEWYIVEYEHDNAVEAVEKTLKSLCKMGKC
jgi:sugar phosphate isomerase/epimerase